MIALFSSSCLSCDWQMMRLYPAGFSMASAPLMTLEKNCLLILGTIMPTVSVDPFLSDDARRLRSYPISAAVLLISSRVAALTRVLPASALDTVEGVMLSAFAMSLIVGLAIFCSILFCVQKYKRLRIFQNFSMKNSYYSCCLLFMRFCCLYFIRYIEGFVVGAFLNRLHVILRVVATFAH